MSEPSSRSLEVATRILNFLDDAMAHDGITDVREIALALDAARAEAWAEGFEAAKAVVIAMNAAEKIGESEERTTDE